MKGYLKCYDMILHTDSPVFIGSGRDYSKKEYILRSKEGRVYIPNQNRLYGELKKRNLEDKFIDFMLSDDRDGLSQFLYRNRISEKDYLTWMDYAMDCGDYLKTKGTLQICACAKDAYGMPYVPGSSIKGMLRTIFLSHDVKCRKDIQNGSIFTEAKYSNKSRKYYLRQESEQLEQTVFNTLCRVDAEGKEIPRNNPVNDSMSGIIVGDSLSLTTDSLVLCQMVEEQTDGSSHSINLLRESIKPGTDIKFTLTIDQEISNYSIEDIMEAVKTFNSIYTSCFGKYFGRYEKGSDNTVWLGGGSGFVSKTVLYPLFGHDKGLDTAVQVFTHTLPQGIQEKHKHSRDIGKGVSPHILKTTQFNDKRYQMGMCRLSYSEK